MTKNIEIIMKEYLKVSYFLVCKCETFPISIFVGQWWTRIACNQKSQQSQ